MGSKNGKSPPITTGSTRGCVVSGSSRGVRALGLCAVVACLAVAACAGPQAVGTNDPLEPTNRAIFRVNRWWDRCCLVPTLERYRTWVPAEGRQAIHNFLGNLGAPITFVNDIAQGETERGRQTVERFAINSTLGVGGLFDPATRWGVAPHSEDAGQTLGVWGVNEGPYLVIPLLGPSNPRDVAGITANVLLDPTNLIPLKQHLWWAGFRQYTVLVDVRSETLDALREVERNSVDYYASMRSLYRQARADQIRNGKPAPAENLPDL